MVSTANVFTTWMADVNKGLSRDKIFLQWNFYNSIDFLNRSLWWLIINRWKPFLLNLIEV